MDWLTVGISLVSGGLAGAGVNILFQATNRKREYRALVYGYCTGFSSTYGRCVVYAEQAAAGQVSFSTLFDFPDASSLTKFASVCEKPEIYASVLEIKSRIFQISRHVEEAARYACEGKPLEATQAQGRAIAFLKSGHDDLAKDLELLLGEAKEIKLNVDELLGRLSKSREKYKALGI